ncbi:MAG TPA: 7TM diverse intracellular signaling domain-containing protein [Oligoflexus sp.]|uniref:7TM diverse intracellular signaling domain-containing protein n=1 Tax=Oligoflexus sp. TaxID=1971216 RepID=UPI002D8081AD|nr:7TM diverse intracellular signaling domain-containing protein [Oligoflexus sp.]HET9238015.1 7TM diverse intracellular signaling domain-containing protein [Oligoflexus sp.]
MKTGPFFKNFILALALLLASPLVRAEPHAIDLPRPGESGKILLSHSFQVLFDPSRQLEAQDLLKAEHDGRFQDMNGQDVYQLQRGHFWLRVTLVNPAAEPASYRLVNHFPYSDRILLYQLENGSLTPKAQRGDFIHAGPEANDHRLPNFPLRLAPGPTTFYVLYDTMGAVNLRFSVMTEESFTSTSRSDSMFVGLLFGFVAVMIGYNIFLAIRLRNPSYYLYVGYIASFAVVQLIFTGTAQYLLPESWLTTIILNQGLVISAELTAICGSLFAISFLSIPINSPLLYKMMLGFFPLAAFDIVLSFVDFDKSVSFVLFTNTYISVALLLAGVQGCMRRYRPAYFYLAAWSFLIVGSLITMARIYGFLPDNAFTSWSQFVGGAMEVVLLSLAMGDKMSLIQEESHREISKLATDLNVANSALKDHIENVEAIVEEKTRDIKSMLANIPQGIFMISAQDGMIMPDYSVHLSSILGTKTIAGRSVRDILLSRSDMSADQMDQTETVIMSALGDSSLNFEVNQNLLVKELLFSLPQTSKILELEWNPICDDEDRVEKILVTLRDVTQIRELERQREEQQRELEAIGKVLKVPSDKFNNFLATCEDFMGSCAKTLQSERTLNTKSINKVFMNIHTMKGMARTYHLDDLANAFHEFESQLEPHRNREGAQLESSVLGRYLQGAEERIQFYQQINSEKLGRKSGSKADLDQHAWIRSKVQKLRGIDMSRMKPEERETLSQVIEGLEQRYAVNLEKSLETILHSLPDMANVLGKASPQVIFEHDEVLLSSEGQLLAERIFVHLLNNAIDHGIESIEERKKVGKPRRGEIRINTWLEGDELLITIQDDGQGLNLRKIFKKAMERGLFKSEPPTAAELANLIFEAGFSTKEEATLTSGRGVGMDAVRTYLINFNSSIELQLMEPDRLRGDLEPMAFRFLLRLEQKLFIQPHRQKVQEVA